MSLTERQLFWQQQLQQQLNPIMPARQAAPSLPSQRKNNAVIQMSLRGQDEEVKGSEEGGDDKSDICFICHGNKAVVASFCCGKLTTCLACTRTMYEGKAVGSVQCLNCRANVQHVARIS